MKLFLLGMMGAGKTYWAQKIAEKENMGWVDLDAQIEKATSITIKEIFDTYGENFFREKERNVLQKLSIFQQLIIATGGGTPCFYNNMQWMNENGITIWIDEPVEVLAERLKKEKEHRPLLEGLSNEQLHGYLSKKLKERTSFYSLAQYHLQGQTISEHSFAKILKNHE